MSKEENMQHFIDMTLVQVSIEEIKKMSKEEILEEIRELNFILKALEQNEEFEECCEVRDDIIALKEVYNNK